MTLLDNVMKIGGSAMILREITDGIRRTGIYREETLRRDRAGMLALGVVIGGTIGAVAGILLAPRAGKETREDLSRRGSEAWEKVKDNASATGHQLVSAVEEKSSHVRTAAEKVVDAARQSFKEPAGESQEDNG